MSTRIVILAAGQGKRMHSDLPKVLHPLAGKPLLEHVIYTALNLVPTAPPLVIYGHEGEQVQKALGHWNVQWIAQDQQLGTGHALRQALPHLADYERVLVLYGDVPLIAHETLKKFIEETPAEALGLMTAHLPDPRGYGRILRDEDRSLRAIVEERDADEYLRNIKEVNTGIYYASASHLKKWLPLLAKHNAQGEYYLTDIIPMALAENINIYTAQPSCIEEILGVNDRQQLNYLERYYQENLALKLMRQGVTVYDPKRLDVRGELLVGHDVVIDVNVVIEGRVEIGNHCVIGPNVCLRNTQIGNAVEIRANSVIDGAEISDGCVIGPFARLRPGTVLAPKAHIGNFVEIKNSFIGESSKASHLTYLGDAEVGKRVNIGAGTITCNYDGVNKNKTIIGDEASVGAGTQLVAPVMVGAGAYIGAGSTITKDAPAQQLTLARSKQLTVENWRSAKQKKEKEQI